VVIVQAREGWNGDTRVRRYVSWEMLNRSLADRLSSAASLNESGQSTQAQRAVLSISCLNIRIRFGGRPGRVVAAVGYSSDAAGIETVAQANDPRPVQPPDLLRSPGNGHDGARATSGLAPTQGG